MIDEFNYENPQRIGKTELARKLGYSKKAMMRIINQTGNLKQRLIAETGYMPTSKEFSPKQMEMICDVIGFPIKDPTNSK